MTALLPTRTEYQPVRLTARDFWLLADAGAFEAYVKTELIEGEIWVVNSVHSRHARAHATLSLELGLALRTTRSPYSLYLTPSTNLSDDLVPEPDLAVAERVDAKVLAGSDLRLAIEIADTTLATDLGRKARLYARYAIPEYWVVDIEGCVIHQMWVPGVDGYAERRTMSFGTIIASETLVGLDVDTTGLL